MQTNKLNYAMQFKDLEIGDRFTIPKWNRHASNLPDQYAIKISEMVHEVRSRNENPRLIKEWHGCQTISVPTWIDPNDEVEVLPKLERSFGYNNCLPVIGQKVWFYDEHIGGSYCIYCNVRRGVVYRIFQKICEILEPDGDITSAHVCAMYDHQPKIAEELIEEFWGEYPGKVLI